MKGFTKHIGKVVMYSIWFGVVTVVFFFPLGFHHMYKIGVLPFLFLDGESPQPGGLMWGVYEVHFMPLNLAINCLLWITSLAVIYWWLRDLDSNSNIS